jgi:phenylpropionate dioxygenase-like ring-hydroxylating dioxygenase large terminal subunit
MPDRSKRKSTAMGCHLFVFCSFLIASFFSWTVYSLALDSAATTTTTATAKATLAPAAAAATTTTTTTTTTSSVNQQALADAPPFPRTWIPLASTFELDPDRPTPLKFLNQDYVAYRENNAEQWIVMDDACPHRLAPLSEGRIDREKNRIECSYHGWSFDSTGSCKHIPQIDDGSNVDVDGDTDQERSSSGSRGTSSSSAPLRAALASPRSRVASYPTQVHKNILFAWLWPEDPLSMILLHGSSSSSLPGGGEDMAAATPEGMLDGAANNATTYTRDLPYSWEILVENLIGKKRKDKNV